MRRVGGSGWELRLRGLKRWVQIARVRVLGLEELGHVELGIRV